jgi:hypothetical protein
MQSACAFPPAAVRQPHDGCRPALCCYFASYNLLQAQAGYDSAKGAASDAASTAQDKASQYAQAGQEQVSLPCMTDASRNLPVCITCALKRPDSSTCSLQGEGLLHRAAAAVGLASDKAQETKEAAKDQASKGYAVS